MKTAVEYWKDILLYFTTRETYSSMLGSEKLLSLLGTVLTLKKFVTGAKLIQGDFVCSKMCFLCRILIPNRFDDLFESLCISRDFELT